MPYPRVLGDAVTLCDGTVMVVGGGQRGIAVRCCTLLSKWERERDCLLGWAGLRVHWSGRQCRLRAFFPPQFASHLNQRRLYVSRPPGLEPQALLLPLQGRLHLGLQEAVHW